MRPSLPKSASSSSVVRRNSVYVEVPVASYQTPLADSGASSSKENTPMRPNRSSKVIPSDGISVSKKRKLSDASHKAVERPTRTEPGVKKARLSKPSLEDQHGDDHNDTIEGPSDSIFYCHQCNRKQSWPSEPHIIILCQTELIVFVRWSTVHEEGDSRPRGALWRQVLRKLPS